MVASAINLVDMHKLLEQNELLWCIPHKTLPEQMNMDNVTTEVMPRTCARQKRILDNRRHAKQVVVVQLEC